MSANVLPLLSVPYEVATWLAWVEREIEMHPSGRRCRRRVVDAVLTVLMMMVSVNCKLVSR